MWIDRLGDFGEGVTGKGLISFAAQKCRGAGEELEAAKVMRPRGELNHGRARGFSGDIELFLRNPCRPVGTGMD
jgi:hypothetical protein